MDQELIAYFDERFNSLDERFDALREEMQQTNNALREEMQQTNNALREEIRHTHVTIEGIRADFRVVADGVLGVDEKLEAFRKELNDRSDEMLSILRRMPPYAKLDGRVTALEDWRGRLGSDPIEVIRERFGLRKSSD